MQSVPQRRPRRSRSSRNMSPSTTRDAADHSETPSSAPATEATVAAAAAPAVNEFVPLVFDGLTLDFASTIAAITAETSIERLQSIAHAYRHQEGTVRTPMMLVQVLALVREFECQLIHDVAAATAIASFDVNSTIQDRLQQHVWQFYGNEPKHEWRGRFACRLYESQLRATSDQMDQLLEAMGAVHLTSLSELWSLLLPDNPLLLTLVLRRIATDRLSHTRVREIVKRIDLAKIVRKPPIKQADTEELALAIVFVATATKPQVVTATPNTSSLNLRPRNHSASFSYASKPPSRKRKARSAATADSKEEKEEFELDDEMRPTPHGGTAATAAMSGQNDAQPISSLDASCSTSPPIASEQPSAPMDIDSDPRLDQMGAADEPISDVIESAPKEGQNDAQPISSLDASCSTSPPIASEQPSAPMDIDSDPRLDQMGAADEPISDEEQRQFESATKKSREEAARMTAVTPQQHQEYDLQVQQASNAAGLEIHRVPGVGDCLFASTALACEKLGIDLRKQLGSDHKVADASDLRTFLARWIREHKDRLYAISGGDDSWRGDVFIGRTNKRLGRIPGQRKTLDQCLDELADTTERKYDIPWSSIDADAGPTNLGDYLPQLLAEALHLRIVLVTPKNPLMTAGLRDSVGELLAPPDRNIMLVQTIYRNHWNVALPRTRCGSAADLPTLAPTIAAAASSDVETPSATDVLDSERIESIQSAPPSTPAASEGSAGMSTPASENTSESGFPLGDARRHRIFAESSKESDLQSLRTQLAEAQAALEKRQANHELEIQRIQEEHINENEAKARRTAEATQMVQTCVRNLEQMRTDHLERIRHGGPGEAPNMVAKQLQQILDAQADVPIYDGVVPIFHTTAGQLDEWTQDIETVEAALGGPFRLVNPEQIVDQTARQVLSLLAGWLHQLQVHDAANSDFTFMEMLLLVMKLRCIDQLLTAVQDGEKPPYRLLELRAANLRALTHRRVWSFVMRQPCSYLNSARDRLARRGASFFQSAALDAPNVLEQARLVVDQCKILDECDLLSEAKYLDTIFEYPQAPFAALLELHTDYPASGPPFNRNDLKLCDLITQGEHDARQLDQQGDVDGANAARDQVQNLRANQPHTFEHRMAQSQMFFHPDKRKSDLDTSTADKANQFALIKDAWSTICACRAHFQELRIYQAQVQELRIYQAQVAAMYKD